MSNVINASFEVTSWDEQPFDGRADVSKLTPRTSPSPTAAGSKAIR